MAEPSRSRGRRGDQGRLRRRPPSTRASNALTRPEHFYTETINGTCYDGGTAHLLEGAAQLAVGDVRAEQQRHEPNRCDPNLHDTCSDPWGTTSSTPYAKGQPVPPQSAQLQQAMTAAGLNKAFNNYYLTGVAERIRQQRPARAAGQFLRRVQRGRGTRTGLRHHPPPYAYFDGKAPNPPGTPEDNFGGPPKGWSPPVRVQSAEPERQPHAGRSELDVAGFLLDVGLDAGQASD